MNSNVPPSPQPDSNAGFLRLWTRHEPALRAVIRSCVWRVEDVEEIMQEVSVIAWQKFASLEDHAKFPQWVAMIARYEILMTQRRHARNRMYFSEDIINKLAEEGGEEMSLRHQQLDALDSCIGKLPEERRQLTLQAYARGTSMKKLAAQLKRTEGSLYQLLARIRQELFQCMERQLLNGPQTP